jgi:two-component system nitrate/nitrite response regulator NarL
MTEKIRVTILDDHQSIVDGYRYRLQDTPQIEVVATIAYGEELEPALANHPTDVLLLDVNVPASPDNINPYPILHVIPKLLQLYPDLNILVISMYAERSLVRAVMDAGANGYILKDDQASIRNLGNVVLTIANGAIHFSNRAHQLLLKNHPGSDDEPLLSPRQLEALSLCQTYPNDSTTQLAARLSVANSTVRNLLSGAYVKLDVHTRSAAIAKAQQLGLITTTPQSNIA